MSKETIAKIDRIITPLGYAGMIGSITLSFGVITIKAIEEYEKNNPNPIPKEVPIGSFENSFNLDLQLTPAPQP